MNTRKEHYILAIDLGTSGPKSAIVSTSGNVVDVAFEQTPVQLLPHGGAEQDPALWWKAIISTSRQVLDKHPVLKKEIIAVCCSTQWSGTVAVDENGNHLMNAIIWLDARGSTYIRKMIDGPVKISGYDMFKLRHWITRTGGAPSHSGKDPIAHILYIKNRMPQIYASTYKFLEPKDYINLKFTGKFAASYDSITLHWITDNRDISNIKYDDRLIQYSGVARDKFPDLKKAVDVLGPIKKDVADLLGLSENVRVIMGTPDIQAATIGSGAVKDFQAHLYIGTSSWLTCHVPYKKTDLFHGLASLPSAVPDRYFVANEQETAGACLTYLRDNIVYHKDDLLMEERLPDVYKIFDRLAATVSPGSDKVIFTPWLYGERTPIEDHTVRSAIFNQSLSTTRAHLVRAVFEGVAYNSRWLLTYVEKFIKRQFDAINMIGGGANSNVWCQIFADVLNRKINQVKDPIHANVRGAGLLGAMALGCIALDDIPDKVDIAHTYTPDPANRKIYDQLFTEFLNIYKCNRKIYKRLNRTHK